MPRDFQICKHTAGLCSFLFVLLHAESFIMERYFLYNMFQALRTFRVRRRVLRFIHLRHMNDYTIIAIGVIFQLNPFARKSNRYVVKTPATEVDILIMFVLEPVAPG